MPNLTEPTFAPLAKPAAATASLATAMDEAESLAKAVDEAAADVAQLDEVPRKAADELRAAVEAAHRAALVTIVRTLRADAAGRALLHELVADPLIRMLFSLHGIIRTDTPAGVGASGEHNAAARTGHEHGASRQSAGGCGTSAGGGCGCGQTAGGGCGSNADTAQLSAVPELPHTIIPLSAIGLRQPLDIWPGNAP